MKYVRSDIAGKTSIAIGTTRQLRPRFYYELAQRRYASPSTAIKYKGRRLPYMPTQDYARSGLPKALQ